MGDPAAPGRMGSSQLFDSRENAAFTIQPHASLLVWNMAEGLAVTFPEINMKTIAVYVHTGKRANARAMSVLTNGREGEVFRVTASTWSWGWEWGGEVQRDACVVDVGQRRLREASV